MTANRRIVLNIAATYGRSLYALVVGLFCGRWLLMALGKTDYGLLGVVGGLAAFISYFNSILAGSYGRFFALAVGVGTRDRQTGIERGRMWFTTAMVIQLLVPTFLMLVGYPIGEWAVCSFLVIPPDRVESCVWVWRFVCLSSYFGMVTIPLNAMYAAHQYIAELTLYSVATTTANAFFLYYIVTHEGLWLTPVACWHCLIAILPNAVIALRAVYLFPECRIVRRHLRCLANVKELSSYAFWNAWGALGATLREQGMAVLVNKYFGPVVNAGIAIGSTLSSQCNVLCGGLQSAFSPAIYNAWGARDFDRARKFSFLTCKFGAFCVLVFAVPLTLEVREVLSLWLGDPPAWAAEMCVFVLAASVIDRVSSGHLICVCANGRIALYQAVLGTIVVLAMPVAWLLMALGVGVWSVGIAAILTMSFCSSGRVLFARKLVGMSMAHWLKSVIVPLLACVAMSFAVGCIPRLYLSASFARVCVTTFFCELALFGVGWVVLLADDERNYILRRFWRRRTANG